MEAITILIDKEGLPSTPRLLIRGGVELYSPLAQRLIRILNIVCEEDDPCPNADALLHLLCLVTAHSRVEEEKLGFALRRGHRYPANAAAVVHIGHYLKSQFITVKLERTTLITH